ncbi:YlbE-like family protein [Halalkalibacterium ligniniphilum]|uniref:YlbE-like family protein n=1 Tax=Halalkalibacterium ligniniphilum TaxID=1134413 RepID=UPI00034DC46C|nr:YlbE-like family protein [Halalkalibacterium ligniniphilum]
MRREIVQAMITQPELRRFVRQHPIWYRRLSRDPSLLAEMEKEANLFYGRTFSQRVEKFQQNLGLAMMLVEMLRTNRG